MSTRIRYSKENNGLLKSMRTFTVQTSEGLSSDVIIKLDPQNNKFFVVDASTEDLVVEGGRTTNLSVLKIQAKKALTKLGVEFGTETRDRGLKNEETTSSEIN